MAARDTDVRSAEGEFLLDTYMDALTRQAGAKYVWPFAMLDESSTLLYWLLFSTNNIRGLEEMKRAMWKVDRTGCFSFSDRYALNQIQLLASFDDQWLASHMRRHLDGRTMTVEAINEYVLTQTPAYQYRAALKALHDEGTAVVVNPPRGYRRGDFSDPALSVRFHHVPDLFGR